jgi:hypothetical protein
MIKKNLQALRSKCQMPIIIVNEIQMLISCYNLISIVNWLALSVHYFEIFSDFYCDYCYFQSVLAFVWFYSFKKSSLLAENTNKNETWL